MYVCTYEVPACLINGYLNAICAGVYISDFVFFFVIASWFLFFFNVITANDGLTTVIIDH